jgi:hypothetical protein
VHEQSLRMGQRQIYMSDFAKYGQLRDGPNEPGFWALTYADRSINTQYSKGID